MRSTIREDIKDFVDLRLLKMNLVAKAYVRLMIWKMNEAEGKPKIHLYNWNALIQ